MDVRFQLFASDVKRVFARLFHSPILLVERRFKTIFYHNNPIYHNLIFMCMQKRFWLTVENQQGWDGFGTSMMRLWFSSEKSD